MAGESTQSEVVSGDGLLASLTIDPPADTYHVTNDIAPAALFKILFTVATVWLVIRIFPVIVLIVFSLMLVATFNPLVRRLQAHLGRSWAILGVVSGLVLLFMGTLVLLIPPLISQGTLLFQHLPQYTQQLQQILARHHIYIHLYRHVAHLVRNPGIVAPQVVDLLSDVARGITAFMTVAILTIYLLIEGPQVGTSMMRLLPRRDRLQARKLIMTISAQVGGYMRGQIITSALAWAFSFLTLWLLHVPGALALGALAAIADAIPLIGLLIALLPAALTALTVSPATAGIVVAAYMLYHFIEDHLITPKIYGQTLGLSLSVIVISLLIGVELMGALGAVLALPVAAAIPSIVTYIQEWQESHSADDTEPNLP